jgi:hypothetical protein
VGAGEALSLATPRLPLRREEALVGASAAWLLTGLLAVAAVTGRRGAWRRAGAGAGLAAILALAAAGLAPAPERTAIVVDQETLVRAGPAPRAEVLGRLGTGGVVRVIERRGAWIHVRPTAGVEGWVPASAVPALDA